MKGGHTALFKHGTRDLPCLQAQAGFLERVLLQLRAQGWVRLKREEALRSDGGMGKSGDESAPDRGSSWSKALFAQLGSLDNFFPRVTTV